MLKISFKTKLFKINSWTILRLPEEASAQLPSRGMTMVTGTLNGIPFKTLLEPDGRYGGGKKPSHWFRVDKSLFKYSNVKAGPPATLALALRAGDTVKVELSPTKEWIRPETPQDMKQAIVKNKDIHRLWNDITPLAQWDWVRWVRAVKTEETRRKHIDIMLSKLGKGMRRPCCFNRNLCSEPAVSKNWALLEPNS